MLANVVCFLGSCFAKQAYVTPDSEAIDAFETKDALEPYEPSFILSVFQGKQDADISHEVMNAAVEFLVSVNQAELRKYPGLPSLYQSGVTYEHVDGRYDTAWKDVISAYKSKKGNCKVLAAIRIAENRNRGIRCYPMLTQNINDDGTQDWHVAVIYPNRAVEDPSRKLGM